MTDTATLEEFARSLSTLSLASIKNYAAVCAYVAQTPKVLLDSLQKNLGIAKDQRVLFEDLFSYLRDENQQMIKNLNDDKLPVYTGPKELENELIESLAALKTSLNEEEFHTLILKTPAELEKT